MIILITGTPGSGKTLYAVSKILEYVKKDREVYADIDGLQMQGVMEAPDDWRDTPDGSVVVYDEAQQRDTFKKGRAVLSQDEIVKALEVHRHSGHDIIFITQSPKFLHTHITELVGEHYHLHRPYGASLANVYLWRRSMLNPNTKSAKDQKEADFLFKHDKELFKHYKSASVHTHKLKIPTKLLMFLALPFVLAYGVYHFATQSTQVKSMAGVKPDMTKTEPQITSSNQTSTNELPKIEPLKDQITKDLQTKMQERYSHNLHLINYNPILHVSAVITTETTCKAFNEYGERINMTIQECFEESSRVVSGRTRGNDLRSNAHQGNEQQTETDTAQTV